MCFTQVRSLEALSKPAVDRSEQIARFGALALTDQQASKTERPTELEALRLLQTRRVDGRPKLGFDLAGIGALRE
jgi:hypothetical protein